MSLKHIIILLINTTALLGYSQKQQTDYYYQGENGETVYRVDSLAHRNMYMLSNYYIDSATGIPYDGVLTIKSNKHTYPFDSLCIQKGILNGFHKDYWVTSNPYSEETINDIEYSDPKNGYMVMVNGINLHNNTKRSLKIRQAEFDFEKSDFEKYNDFEIKTFLTYDITYKNEYINVKRSFSYVQEGKKKKQHMKFKTLDELESYFKSKDYMFFEKCKEMGFFEDKIVVPIIKGNC